MQRTLQGIEAYNTMLSAAVPERTKTYTPVAHHQVLGLVRQELYKAGFTIQSEECRSTVNGAVIALNFGITYKLDPDLILSATFINSYDKSARFQFSLGALVKHGMTNLIISKTDEESLVRKHTGDAVTIIHDHIKASIKQAGEYWDELVRVKDILKDHRLSTHAMERTFGKLIMNDVLDSVQMTQLRKSLKNPAVSWHVDYENAWNWYNHIASALKNSHPNTWLIDHIKVYEIFNELLYLGKVAGPPAISLTPDPSEMPEDTEEELVPVDEEPEWDTLREQNDDYDL